LMNTHAVILQRVHSHCHTPFWCVSLLSAYAPVFDAAG
jgi:hypothetical protein